MNNPNDKKLSVDELTSRMLRKRTIIPRFRWNLHVNDCERLLTAAYVAEVKARGGVFTAGDANVNIHNVAQALHDLQGLKRGFILCGDCGNGKTTMMHAVAAATAFMQDELQQFARYMPGYGTYKTDVRFYFADAMECAYGDEKGTSDTASRPILVIEDLGQEPLEVQRYGNIYNPVIDILEKRYELCLPTFITTNLSPEQLGSRYGKRIRERLRETMFTLPFDNPSYRH